MTWWAAPRRVLTIMLGNFDMSWEPKLQHNSIEVQVIESHLLSKFNLTKLYESQIFNSDLESSSFFLFTMTLLSSFTFNLLLMLTSSLPLHDPAFLFPFPPPPRPPLHLSGRGIPRQRGAEEGRELPYASEKRSILLGARPGLAPRGDASFILWVSPAGRGSQAEGREAAVQDADRRRATSLSQRLGLNIEW